MYTLNPIILPRRKKIRFLVSSVATKDGYIIVIFTLFFFQKKRGAHYYCQVP